MPMNCDKMMKSNSPLLVVDKKDSAISSAARLLYCRCGVTLARTAYSMINWDGGMIMYVYTLSSPHPS